MKKNSCFLILLMLVHFVSISQTNKVKIIYSIKNEKTLQVRQKIIDKDTLIGYGPADRIFFKNKLNLKLFFFYDKLFLNNKLLYCFSNVQYYESLLFVSFKGKEYLYIYPHYYGRTGPYSWYELGVLIEIKAIPIVKEKMNYFEDYEVKNMMKFNKYKIKKTKSKICTDGNIK